MPAARLPQALARISSSPAPAIRAIEGAAFTTAEAVIVDDDRIEFVGARTDAPVARPILMQVAWTTVNRDGKSVRMRN